MISMVIKIAIIGSWKPNKLPSLFILLVGYDSKNLWWFSHKSLILFLLETAFNLPFLIVTHIHTSLPWQKKSGHHRIGKHKICLVYTLSSMFCLSTGAKKGPKCPRSNESEKKKERWTFRRNPNPNGPDFYIYVFRFRNENVPLHLFRSMR